MKLERSDKFIIFLIILFSIIATIVLTIVKANNETFKLGYLLLSVLGVVFVLSLFGVGFHYFFNKNKDNNVLQDKRLPKAVTVEEARKFAVDLIKNTEQYADYIKDGFKEEVQLLGKGIKSKVYTFKGRGKYEDVDYYVILNMHYPTEVCSVLINPSESEIYIAKINSAIYPEEIPAVKTTRTENPLTGIVQTTEEVIKEDKNKQKEEAEE